MRQVPLIPLDISLRHGARTCKKKNILGKKSCQGPSICFRLLEDSSGVRAYSVWKHYSPPLNHSLLHYPIHFIYLSHLSPLSFPSLYPSPPSTLPSHTNPLHPSFPSIDVYELLMSHPLLCNMMVVVITHHQTSSHSVNSQQITPNYYIPRCLSSHE